VGALAHHLKELHDVLDVFIEAEPAVLAVDIAHVVPVGDVDVVLGEHGADGPAQQRGEMSGQRRHQQHPRLLGLDVLLEMQQRAEGRDLRGLLADLDLAIADHRVADAERRPGVGEARAGDQLVGSGQITDGPMAGHTKPGVAERPSRHTGQHTDRAHDVRMGLIGRV
jgi:hypothetical protein